MKTLFVLLSTIWCANSFAQISTHKTDQLIIQSSKGVGGDTSLKVVYENKGNHVEKPAYFLNGKFLRDMLSGTLNPMQIDSIRVIKGNIQIDNFHYSGQIHIKTKSSYTAQLISLTQLKNKYTNLKDKSVVFMIDGSIINADYDSCMVDENYLLTIVVDKIENTKDKIDLGLIKLLSKSDENIRKSKEIRIRGRELALTK